MIRSSMPRHHTARNLSGTGSLSRWPAARPSVFEPGPDPYPGFTDIVGGDRNPYRRAHRHTQVEGRRVGWRGTALIAAGDGLANGAALLLGATAAGFAPRQVLAVGFIGLTAGAIASAGKSGMLERGLAAAGAFMVGAAVPLATLIISPPDAAVASGLTAAVSLLALAGIGAGQGRRRGTPIALAAGQAAATGLLAMTIGTLIGLLLRQSLG